MKDSGRTSDLFVHGYRGQHEAVGGPPEAMRSSLARHDALMLQAIAASGGHVFKTIGDAF